MNIVIDNTEARLIELPSIPPQVATGKELVKDAKLDTKGVMIAPAEYREPGELLAPGFDLQQLLPGENDVDSDYWDLVCSNKGVKIFIAAGYLVNRGEGKASSLVTDIDSVDTATAKSMIMECADIGVLTQWASNTESRGLKKLIGERKGELVDKADGRPVSPKLKDMALGTYGGNVSNVQADGNNDRSHGIGEQAGA